MLILVGHVQLNNFQTIFNSFEPCIGGAVKRHARGHGQRTLGQKQQNKVNGCNQSNLFIVHPFTNVQGHAIALPQPLVVRCPYVRFSAHSHLT